MYCPRAAFSIGKTPDVPRFRINRPNGEPNIRTDTYSVFAAPKALSPQKSLYRAFCILMILFGWGKRIRTFGMPESESGALPLGDTPIQGQMLLVGIDGFEPSE